MSMTSCAQAVTFFLIMFIIKAPIFTDGLTRNVNSEDCSDFYIKTYDDNVIPAFKVLDALQAERIILKRDQQIQNLLWPSIPNVIINYASTTAAVKSVLKLTKYLKSFFGNSENHLKVSVAKLVFTKALEESCRWLKSAHILSEASNCTNLAEDYSEIESIHSQLIFYETLENTFASLRKMMDNVSSNRIHYCSWITNRVLGNCHVNRNQTLIDSLSGMCSRRYGASGCNIPLCSATESVTLV